MSYDEQMMDDDSFWQGVDDGDDYGYGDDPEDDGFWGDDDGNEFDDGPIYGMSYDDFGRSGIQRNRIPSPDEKFSDVLMMLNTSSIMSQEMRGHIDTLKTQFSKLHKNKHKNAVAFVLGFILNKKASTVPITPSLAKTHMKQIIQLRDAIIQIEDISKQFNIEASSVQSEDIIRYARLWGRLS